MKKTGKTAYLLGAVLILFALVFVSCDQGGPGSGLVPPGEDPSKDPPSGKTALAAPGLFQVSSETFLLTWGEVPNAASYSVQIGSTAVTVTEPKHQLDPALADDPAFWIFVTAVPEGGSSSYTSSAQAGFRCEPAMSVFTYDTSAAARALVRAGETFAITGLTVFGKTLPNIVIPEQIGETIVDAIGAGAFEGGSFESVSIAATIRSVGENAFKDCTELAVISFAAHSDTSVPVDPPPFLDETAFAGCENIETIETPPGSDASYGEEILESLPDDIKEGIVIVVSLPSTWLGEWYDPSGAKFRLEAKQLIDSSGYSEPVDFVDITESEAGKKYEIIAYTYFYSSNGSAERWYVKASLEELVNGNLQLTMYRDSRSETMESAKNYDITNSTDTLVMPFSRTPPEIDPDPVDPDPVEPEPEYPITIELDPAADREIVDIGFNTISLKSGYTLHAWYLNNDEQTGGLSLAGLTPDTYYITVVAVDGNGVPWSNSLEVTVGDPNKEDEITIVIDPIAEKEVIEQYDNTSITLKEGYTLFAWYLDGERQSQTGGSTINLPGLGSGNYKVTVIVTDSNGVPWSNNLTVTVNQ